MKYFPMMTEDEIRYVCGVIPSRNATSYFQHNPKEFARICPGFRPSSVTKLDVSNLLFRNRNRGFVEFFIEKHIGDWLAQIREHIDKCLEDGDSRIAALLKTLPQCYFVDNIGLYFKFTGEAYTEETLSVLEASVKIIKDLDAKCEQLQTSLNDESSSLARSEAELERVQNEQAIASKKLGEQLEEIKVLKRANADIEKSKAAIISLEQTIVSMKKMVQEREIEIQLLEADLTSAKNKQQLLEQKIREELAKQQEEEKHKQESAKKPKRPKELDEFRDYLGYNFENIGVPTNADYFPLLKNHLSEILFQGKPIILCRSTGFTLMSCISNTIAKTPIVSTLDFSNTVTEKEIDDFLSQDKRLLCLDNFIGNFNETTLITICDKHRDKIIFLTIVYDHTLAYVPDELMRYCHYINLNRIEGFVGDKELTEDPSSLDEEVADMVTLVPDARWSAFLKETLSELGVNSSLSIHKSSQVSDEVTLCCMLAFDILPYCTDVLKIAPFIISERLVKYAGDSGRCSYKALFGRWFS